MPDRILIAGLRELGVHGVLAEEKTRPQPFEVDLELLVDLGGRRRQRRPRRHRRLRRGLRGGAPRGRRRRATDLLERLAARIAEVCRADPRVLGVVVEVRKLHPPVRATVDHVGVRIER